MPGFRGFLNTKNSARMIDAGKPVASKSKLKRIFERQFPHILRNSTIETPAQAPPNPPPLNPCHLEGSIKVQNKFNAKKTNSTPLVKTASDNFESNGSECEPSSLCLADMVHDFMENGEKNTECGRGRCKCLNGQFNTDANEDEEDDRLGIGSGEMCEILKSLVQCASIWERNILADTSRFVEAASHDTKNMCENKEECTNGCLRRSVVNKLRSYGYNAAVCKSRWDQASGLPAGEYDYIDVIVEGAGMMGKQERLIIDIDFRSQFEIARSTCHYAAVLHSLPLIFVGKPDRLQQIVSIVCEAAKQSLKKKGLHIPPWRKSEYIRAKWLSPYKRTTTNEVAHSFSTVNRGEITSIAVKGSGWGSRFTSEFELQLCSNGVFHPPPVRGATGRGAASPNDSHLDDQITVVVTEWQPPAVKPKTGQRGGKIAAGLASMLREAGLGSKP